MTIDDLWNTEPNLPDERDQAAMVEAARAEVRRLRRNRIAFAAWTALSLSAVSGLVAYTWVSSPEDARGAWAVQVLLVAQWSVLAFWIRDLLRTRTSAGAAPIREAVERLWRESENVRRGQLAVLALFAAAVPLLAAAIEQLRASGRMAPHEATSARVLFGLVLCGATAAILARRHLVGLPRHRRLTALLEQYRAGVGDA